MSESFGLQVYSLQSGPVSDVWRRMGVPVTLIQTCDETEVMVDWLKYVDATYLSISIY